LSRRVVFEPEASDELEASALWYEAQRSGLGLTFLAAIDRTVGHLATWPGAGELVPGVPPHLEVRQMPIGRFPYRVADRTVTSGGFGNSRNRALRSSFEPSSDNADGLI